MEQLLELEPMVGIEPTTYGLRNRKRAFGITVRIPS